MAVWKKCVIVPEGDSPPALFLDRDGVVIVDRGYLGDPDQVKLLPGVAETMVRARKAGYLLIGVSNQSGLGRGLFSRDDLERVMIRQDALLREAGARFDGFYYCPHAPGEGCRCRKPGPGMFEEAAATCRWDPARSWVVGDKASDVAFARDNGLGAVLVLTGYGADQQDDVRRRWPDDPRVKVASDLTEAFAVLSGDRKGGPSS